jgi:hypothetical protein
MPENHCLSPFKYASQAHLAAAVQKTSFVGTLLVTASDLRISRLRSSFCKGTLPKRVREDTQK